MENVIEVRNIKKSFNEKVVVNSISFSVKQRSLFAFIGQNGAGKTTTINMIIGLLNCDDGEIIYNNSSDFAHYKNKIGVVFQNNILDDLLTVEENLITYGSLYIKSQKEVRHRLSEIVELLSLEDVLNQPFKTLSGGQKRKAEIARALFMSPEILFLDEPTTGLDPRTRAEVWEIIHELKNKNGLSVFLTTHYMEETAFADSVAIIHKGNIVAVGSPAELKSQFTYDRLMITPVDADKLEQQLKQLEIESHKVADTYMVKIDDVAQSINLLASLKSNIRFYEMIKGTMDDVFLSAVGEKVRENGVTI